VVSDTWSVMRDEENMNEELKTHKDLDTWKDLLPVGIRSIIKEVYKVS